MSNPSHAQRCALIVGGGIGGLAAALALAQAGFKVEVFERTPQFTEIGAGIQLGPNSLRALNALGVGERATQLTVHPEALVMRDALDGRTVVRIETRAAFERRFGAPYGLIHRADLHAALLAVARSSRDITLHSKQMIDQFADRGDHVIIETPGGPVRGDLLVGADGLWSKTRQYIVGDGPPRRSGHIAYRAVLPTAEIPAHLRQQEMVLWAGPKCHLVHYPLRGGELFNLVAVFHSERYEEGWDSTGDPEELHAHFVGTHPDVQTMLAKITQWRMWVLCDREPIANWSRGRMTLLGDAAHPMLQYLAQGAGMAMEDAVCLGRCLSDRAASVEDALVQYQKNRYLRTGRVQLTARLYGEFYHAAGVRRELRNHFLASGLNVEGLAWLYDYVADGTQLSNRHRSSTPTE